MTDLFSGILFALNAHYILCLIKVSRKILLKLVSICDIKSCLYKDVVLLAIKKIIFFRKDVH